MVEAPATVKTLDVADVSPLDVALKVKLPCVPSATTQPANVATPAIAVTGLVVQFSVPVPVASNSVTDAVEVVTTSPEESSILAIGCTVIFDPPVDDVG